MAWRPPRSAAAAAGVVALLTGCGDSSDGGGRPAEQRRETIAWSFVSMAPSTRAVRITYTYGGCQRAPREVVTRGRGSVRITVSVSEPVGREVVCTAIARVARPLVALDGPLAGRRLLGWSRAEPSPAPRCAPRVLMPSVVGMAAADAWRALRDLGLRPSGQRGRPITAQLPAAGTCVPPGRRVVLRAR